MALADELARYATELSFADLDDRTVDAAKQRIIDAIGCAYAGMDEDAVRTVLEYCREKTGKTDAPILGGGTSSVEYATLATGTIIRYLDWNDTYLSKEPGHPSDNLGALLPVAAAHRCSGEELLAATALAYEVQCRLCDAASLRANGFDHVNYGLVSTALGAGQLMGLDREALAESVNIAVNGHVALRQARAGQLTAWKGIAFANAARNGVVAAQLASRGLSGPAPIFEGEFGVYRQLTGAFDLDVDAFGGQDGRYMLPQTYLKYYPVEYHAQAAVHCALALAEEHDIGPDDIKKVENKTYEAAVSIIADEEKWRPETRETADHSMPYCIARAFLDREMTLTQFTSEKVRDERVRNLMDRITVEENTSFTERYGAAFPHRMVVHTTDGERYEKTMDHPLGHPDNPVSNAQVEEKLRAHGPDTTDAALDVLRRLETVDDVNRLYTVMDTE